MTTPDTTTARSQQDDLYVEALEEAFAAAESADGLPEGTSLVDLFMEHLQPVIDDHRRQAAADALRNQADALAKTAAFMRDQARAHTIKVRRGDAVVYDSMADAYFGAAKRCRDAAADKLAEGYEYECAAFSQECETRVPDAGDFCSKHEPEDDDDPRWAE